MLAHTLRYLTPVFFNVKPCSLPTDTLLHSYLEPLTQRVPLQVMAPTPCQ